MPVDPSAQGRPADPAIATVTGAGRGIGRAIAAALAAEGVSVLVADVDDGVAGDVAQELSGDGAQVEGFGGDLSTPDGAARMVASARERFGGLDVLVNNAGGGVIRRFLDHDEDSLRETLDRNLMTTIRCCQAALPVMREQRYGRIVNVGAESVRNGLSMHALYNAAKGGVHGLTTGLAREFAPDGITVNTVAPSMVETDDVKGMLARRDELAPEWQGLLDEAVTLIPIGRSATLEEVAAVVVFLASERASFVTGQVVSVNGGSSML